MADTTATKARIRQYVQRVGQAAFERQVELDTEFVPRGTSPHFDGSPRLSETRQVERTATGGSITYPTMVANYTNTGTEAHPIVAKVGRSLVFVWPAGPPALASPRGSSTFHFKSVMWKPGVGVANNIGWWDRRVNPEQWSRSVAGAASSVQF